MKNKAGKICFVLQQHTPGTHMDYVHEMARTLRHDEGLPLTLLVEKGKCSKDEKDWCVVQRFQRMPLRAVENLYRIFFMRLSGYTTFYVHYSFLSAISAGLATKLFGGTVYYWNCGQPWMYKRSFATELYQKFAYRLIDYLVTGVEAVVPGYLETYGLAREQVRIIPNWIDLEAIMKDPEDRIKTRDKYRVEPDTKLLLFLHTLSTRYGAEFLPEILEQIKDKDVHLIVAGDGYLRGQLVEEFEKRELSNKVTLLGYVDRGEVERLLTAADIFLMPSEGAGSPHSLIEAMAYQLPFVTFDVGGVKETVPPDTLSFVYKYGDIEGLTRGIKTLLDDPQKYQSVQNAEKAWMHHFSKPTITQKFTELFDGPNKG